MAFRYSPSPPSQFARLCGLLPTSTINVKCLWELIGNQVDQGHFHQVAYTTLLSRLYRPQSEWHITYPTFNNTIVSLLLLLCWLLSSHFINRLSHIYYEC